MDPLTLLALFGPALKDGAMALVKKWTGDAAAKPANVQEAILLMQAETEQLKVRNTVGDAEGATYPWVIAAIKLQRPIVVYGTLLTFICMTSYNLGTPQTRVFIANLTSTVICWLFGERYQMKGKQ